MGFFQKTDEKKDNDINRVVELPVSAISPNPNQPRLIFDDYELSQLAVSIQQNGILQPITVRQIGEAGEAAYELIAGERRLRAAKLINMEFIPAIVMKMDDEKSSIVAIMENIQRSDLNYIEEAFAIRHLIEHFGITQEETAAKLGVAQSTVANKLRLLKLSDEEKALVLRYRLNERQARALLRLPEEQRMPAIQQISALQLNTMQTDRYVDEQLAGKTEKKQQKIIYRIKGVRIYINTFNKAIQSMRDAGIDCHAEKNKTDDFIEYKVRIPLK